MIRYRTPDMGVPGGAGFRRAPGPRGVGIGLFLPRGTKRMRIWIKNDAPRKQYVTN